MNISYRVSEEDFLKAARLMIKKKSNVMLRVLPWTGGAVLAAILIQLVKSLYSHESPFATDSPWQIAFGFTLPLMLVCLPWLTRMQLRRQYQRSTIISEPRTLQADFSGLHFHAPSSSSDQAWTNYMAYAEDAWSFLLIQQGNMLFVPIPKRELSNAQIDDVRSTFATYLPCK